VEGLDERGADSTWRGTRRRLTRTDQKADEKKGTENSGGDPDGPEGQHRK